MKIAATLLIIFAAETAGEAPSGDTARPFGMPEELQGIPGKAKGLVEEIRGIVERQLGLAREARQAKTLEERLRIVQELKANVRKTAGKRVAIMEAYAAQARARVEWARKHASAVRDEDLVQSMRQLAHRGPPSVSPLREDASPGKDSETSLPEALRSLPKEIHEARNKLRQAAGRLRAMGEEIENARTEPERERLRKEIAEHLRAVERTRVAVLESILEISEKRLAWARKRFMESRGGAGPNVGGPYPEPAP